VQEPELMRDREWAPCDFYAAYQDARDEVECCLIAWREAPLERRADAFAVYRAAADREDVAAAAWLSACAAYDARLAA
jgi:hypothetical protein